MTEQANETRKMSDEAKAKQAAAMKARWQDPEYRARVAEGRARAKAAKGEPAEQQG